MLMKNAFFSYFVTNFLSFWTLSLMHYFTFINQIPDVTNILQKQLLELAMKQNGFMEGLIKIFKFNEDNIML